MDADDQPPVVSLLALVGCVTVLAAGLGLVGVAAALVVPALVVLADGLLDETTF